MQQVFRSGLDTPEASMKGQSPPNASSRIGRTRWTGALRSVPRPQTDTRRLFRDPVQSLPVRAASALISGLAKRTRRPRPSRPHRRQKMQSATNAGLTTGRIIRRRLHGRTPRWIPLHARGVRIVIMSEVSLNPGRFGVPGLPCTLIKCATGRMYADVTCQPFPSGKVLKRYGLTSSPQCAQVPPTNSHNYQQQSSGCHGDAQVS
jgi:hypothetical protein